MYYVFNAGQNLTVTVKLHKEKGCAEKDVKNSHFIEVHLQFIFYT